MIGKMPAPNSPIGFPPVPKTYTDAGLPLDLLRELVMKIVYKNNHSYGRDIANELCLPWTGVVAPAVESLRAESLLDTTGTASSQTDTDGDFKATLDYRLTGDGKIRVNEALERCKYVGPAPVQLALYSTVTKHQGAQRTPVTRDMLFKAMGRLVLDPRILDRLGAALTSRQSIFLYGPPGNGKSTIAVACAELLGGPVFIPHAILVRNEIIRLFDPVYHRLVPGQLPSHDRRWNLCYRPMVAAGGEMKNDDLELGFSEHNGFYEGSLQMKANGGMLLIDDFGRQQVRPQEILNRLIVPLEAGYDYVNIARASTTVQVPFTAILMLSTNIEPKQLVDEAFLRRVRYKIQIPNPTTEQYKVIMQRACADAKIPYTPDAVDRLIALHYNMKRPLHGCEPRDIIEHLVSSATYMGKPPTLSNELVDHAVDSYFAQMEMSNHPPGQ